MNSDDHLEADTAADDGCDGEEQADIVQCAYCMEIGHLPFYRMPAKRS
ncbi:MAG: hypothetical protein ACLVJ6_03720 [Merdibacter sp.]